MVAVAGAIAVVAAAILFALPHDVGASTGPTVTMTPSGTLHDGQTVSISVGANGAFTPHSHVNIIECADPGGTTDKLPKDITTCDGNTIQGNTILVADNGSFSETGYTLYRLPSTALGEQANFQPVCNESNPCVLFIGQNQNDFTAPKVFSAPFSILAANGSAATTTTVANKQSATTSTAAPSNTTGTSPSSASASASASSTSTTDPASGALATDASSAATLNSEAVSAAGALPNTGVPSELPWLLGIGGLMLLVGSSGRRLALGLTR